MFKFNNILISISLVFIVIGLFIFSSSNSKLSIMNKVAYGGLLSSLTGAKTTTNTASSDTLFLSSLTSLGTIKIDKTFFDAKIFKSLINNSVQISPTSSGRENPFAPIGSVKEEKAIVNDKIITTNQSSGVTSSSVVLNGFIGVSNITSGYFKYGTTEEMKEISSVVQTSTNGFFSKNLSGLTPKNKYFYKACIKVVNVESCGDTMTFTTI